MILDNKHIVQYQNRLVEILVKAFDNNPSVNFIIKNDQKRVNRLKKLMHYALEKLQLSNGILFVNKEITGCAIVLIQPSTLNPFLSFWLDFKLYYHSISLFKVLQIFKIEKEKKKLRATKKYAYVMFLGVDVNEQGKGIGTGLVIEIINYCASKKLPILLETSDQKNVSFYKKLGFEMYYYHESEPNLWFFKYYFVS